MKRFLMLALLVGAMGIGGVALANSAEAGHGCRSGGYGGYGGWYGGYHGHPHSNYWGRGSYYPSQHHGSYYRGYPGHYYGYPGNYYRGGRGGVSFSIGF